MNYITTTFKLSDAFDILNRGWNSYLTGYDPIILLGGMGTCLALTGHDESYFTDEEINFVNMYIDECTNVLSDVPGDNYDC